MAENKENKYENSLWLCWGRSLRQLQSRWPTKTIGSAICVPTPCGPLSSCGLGALPNPYLGHNIDAIVICTYTFNIFTYINFFLGFRNHCDCNLWWPPHRPVRQTYSGGGHCLPAASPGWPRHICTYVYLGICICILSIYLYRQNGGH